MGNCCCKNSRKYLTNANAKKKNLSKYRAHPHIAVCGLEGVGKTTLIYKTILPGWHDITSQIEPTRGFHYEEFVHNNMKIGIWDLPGNAAMRNLWHSFYRYVKMWAVVFVVNLLHTTPEHITEARERLHALTTEDTLADSCFCLIMNTFDTQIEPTLSASKTMAAKLGLNEMNYNVRKRFKYFVVNAKNGKSDEQWVEALNFMFDHFKKLMIEAIVT